jgi:three-Cys-motif partner protein
MSYDAAMPRVVGDWTKDKLRILQLYLAGYLQATTHTRERIYIDAFAGPGLNQIERTGELIHGSPLIALKAKAQNGTRFDHLYFIENDQEILGELTDQITAQDIDHRCEVIPGDVNQQLPKLMQRINRQSPTLVFLDTEGIDPRWSTLEAIAPWQVEFFINFPLGMAINRSRPDSIKTQEYFGTPECLPLLESFTTGRSRALVDFYKGRLANVGLIYSPEHDRLVRTSQNHRLYYLVLASKVEVAKTIMEWVFKQPDYTGQGRLEL